MRMFLTIVLAVALVYQPSFAASSSRGPLYEYDAGPDTSTKEGFNFAKIIAETPNYRAVGTTALQARGDKFKWKMGPMFYRGRTGKDEVKVLIIGQEGAQDENASFRSFTGGTGQRMQHYMKYMGLDRSYVFINTFVYTINGQYAEYAPTMNGSRIRWQNNLTQRMLKMAQYEGSPIVDHRNKLIDHIIRANQKSLKLIIAVGGAAQESLASYIIARGGKCDPINKDPKKYQKVAYKSKWVEKNRYFHYPVDKSGKNLLLASGEKFNGTFNWGSLKGKKIDLKNRAVQTELQKRAAPSSKASAEYKAFAKKLMANVYLPKDGLGNGFHDMRQLGTELVSGSKGCTSGGKRETLKGLRLPSNDMYSSSFTVKNDIRFIKVKHPGSNSPTLNKVFKGELARISKWHKASNGWKLPADKGMSQPFDSGYGYSSTQVPYRDFRLGIPEVIGRASTSTTRKEKGAGLEIGGRSTGAKYASIPDSYKPSSSYTGKDVAWEPNKTNFEDYDQGPGTKWAKLFTSVPKSLLDKKLNPIHDTKFGFGGYYRGRPAQAKYLIVADQHAHDDLWTGRALTGLAGQKLQGLLKAIGAGDDYVIVRTLPVNTLDDKKKRVSDATMNKLLDKSDAWRTKIIDAVISTNKSRLKAILSLGEYADDVIEAYEDAGIPLISLTDGVSSALSDMKSKKVISKSVSASSIKPIPINRKDIPYGLPRWVGTSGDRVITANGSKAGSFYLISAPKWSASMRAKALSSEEKNKLRKLGLD